MKVLFLVNNFPDYENPYAGVFVYNQIKALSAANIDIRVLYFDFRSVRRIRKWGMTKYQYNGIEVYRYAIPCGPVRKLYIWLLEKTSVKAFEKVCKREGEFDLIHAHFTDMGFAASKIKDATGIGYILTEHSSTLLQEEISLTEERIIREAYEKAERVLAVGTALKQKMKQYTTQKIEVVPNILPDRFCIIDELHKDTNEFTFVSVVGTLTKDKKVDLLVEAFATLSKQYPQINLKICGRGALMEEVKQMTERMQMGKRVEFLGVVDNEDLPKVLNRCDCFVLPSVVETFGVVYIEAAGCGLPVIAANSGGTLDIINDNNGIRMENATIEELTKAMQTIIVNKEKYNAQQISEEIHTKFGVKAFTDKINTIYKEVSKKGEQK